MIEPELAWFPAYHRYSCHGKFDESRISKKRKTRIEVRLAQSTLLPEVRSAQAEPVDQVRAND